MHPVEAGAVAGVVTGVVASVVTGVGVVESWRLWGLSGTRREPSSAPRAPTATTRRVGGRI
jgi:hypothetical protein